METKKKLMSLLLALVMIVGTIIPAMAAEGDALPQGIKPTIDESKIVTELPKQTVVNIFKLGGKSYAPKAPWDHNGGVISPQDYAKLGESIKALAGVKFKIYKIKPTGEKGKYSDADYKYLEDLKNNPNSYKTVTNMEEQVKANKVELVKETNATGDDGKVTETLPNGLYWVVESVTPTEPQSVSGAIAVPFGLTLPYTLQEDVGDHKKGTAWLSELNIYPKNILSGKSTTEKHFHTDENGNKIQNNTPVGPKYEQYLNDKEKITKDIGKDVKYTVSTVVPQNSVAEELSWSDLMSKGLAFTKDSLKITVKYTDNNKAEQTVDFTIPDTALTQTYSGFNLVLTTKTLELTTGVKFEDAIKRGDVTFNLEYAAKVTGDAVIDKPLENEITFVPGHNEPKGPDVTTNPQGELKVTKTWEGEADTNNIVTYYLIKDGKVVADISLDQNATGKTFDLGDGITFEVDKTNWYSGTFKGLKKGESYTFQEKVNGYQPEYGKPTDGNITVNNKKNPDIITPEPPSVLVGEKKFVKTDGEAGTNRLAGATFVVKKDNKYLALNDGETKNIYIAAEKAYNDKIAEYNNLSATEQAGTKGQEILKALPTLKTARDVAFKNAQNNYTWVDDKDKALEFVSNNNGQIKVSGLAYGDYQLVEVKAPNGYGLLEEPINFTINGANSTNGNIKYEKDAQGNDKDALNVVNRSLIIPQTGGIGTVIFGVVGIALMAGAVVAMRKRSEA